MTEPQTVPSSAAGPEASGTEAPQTCRMPMRPILVVFGILLLVFSARSVPGMLTGIWDSNEPATFSWGVWSFTGIIFVAFDATMIFTCFWGGLRSLLVSGCLFLLFVAGMVTGLIITPVSHSVRSAPPILQHVDPLAD